MVAALLGIPSPSRKMSSFGSESCPWTMLEMTGESCDVIVSCASVTVPVDLTLSSFCACFIRLAYIEQGSQP